jgi:HicA toxin of bacterial toxin-antitoxin,
MAENYSRDVKAILRKHGCTFVRQGKGDHEIWHSPINNCRFMVDNRIKSPIWGNITLKKAGIPKAF